MAEGVARVERLPVSLLGPDGDTPGRLWGGRGLVKSLSLADSACYNWMVLS